MARMVTRQRTVIATVAAWLAGFLIFFPILWMVLASFKTELEAFATPPSFLFFHWTTENYATVQERSDYFHHALNSIIIAGGSTLLAMLIAIPAAWSMAFAPTKRTKDLLLWMLSTKMMPPVGVLVPIYLIFKNFGLLDTRSGLVFILCLGNLPIVVWMLFTYFKEIPKDILEAARMDGATIGKELIHVLTPMAVPGIASTMLLNIILAWNEAFWTIRLTTTNDNLRALAFYQKLIQFNLRQLGKRASEEQAVASMEQLVQEQLHALGQETSAEQALTAYQRLAETHPDKFKGGAAAWRDLSYTGRIAAQAARNLQPAHREAMQKFYAELNKLTGPRTETPKTP